MIRYFLEQGGEAALWVDPYPTRLPSLLDLGQWRKGLRDQGTSPSVKVRVMKPGALPIEPIPGGSCLNRLFLWRHTLKQIKDFAEPGATLVGIGRPSALAILVLQGLSSCDSFYDAMDDFPAFYRGLSSTSMRRREEMVAKLVNRIFVVSSALEKKFTAWHDVVRVPNACDMSALGPHERRRDGDGVIGYIGTIAAWFDWEVVVRLARAVPDVEIRLIGPCFIRPRTLPDNVNLQGPCSIGQVAEHLRSFSIGLIPFKISPLTASADPIKYYEYRAMGLPILSNSFGDMSFRGVSEGVFFMDREMDLASLVSDANNWRPEFEAVKRFRSENDWQSRFSAIRLFEQEPASHPR